MPLNTKKVNRTEELKRELRIVWVHGHEGYQEAKQKCDDMKEAMNNVKWSEKPSVFVANKYAAVEAYDQAQRELAEIEADLIKFYNRSVGIDDE